MEILKKMTHLNRISAAIILAVGLWVGLGDQCLATDTGGVSYTVDSGDTYGFNSDDSSRYVATDSDGNIYVVYTARNGDSYEDVEIAKSTDGGANWTKTVLFTDSYIRSKPTLVIDSSDNIYVFCTGATSSYPSNSQVMYRKYVNSIEEWSSTLYITEESYIQNDVEVEIDGDDNIYLIWQGKSSSSSSYYQIRSTKSSDGVNWDSIIDVTSGNYTWSAASIDLDSSGHIHAVFLRDGNYIYYSEYTTTWSSPVQIVQRSDISVSSSLHSPSIVVDSTDVVHVAFRGYSSGSPSTTKIAYIKNTGSWQPVEVLVTGSTSYVNVSITADISDVLYITSYTSNTIKVMSYSGGSWSSFNTVVSLTNAKAPNFIRYSETGYLLTYQIQASGTDSVKLFVKDDYIYFNPESAEISITYPVAFSTSKAEYWTTDIATNISGYDKLYVKVRSASTQACAENVACSSAWIDGNKVIGECDGTDSTFDNTSNVSRLAQIPDSMAGETIYATAFLYGVTDATCVDGDGPEVSVLLATSDTVSFTYSTDYITDLSDADEYWAASWADRWGAATSTMSYQAVAGGFDLIMAPVINWASGWSHLFNTTDATAAGISAGSGIQVLMQHAKDFFNVIPGCQLFAILLIAVIIDIAIYIYKNIYRIKKFFTV